MKTKLQPIDYKQDPTAWELHRRKGGSTKEFFSMTLTIMVVIPAFVYVAASVGEPFMKSIYTGPIVTAGILYAFWQLLKVLDGKYK